MICITSLHPGPRSLACSFCGLVHLVRLFHFPGFPWFTINEWIINAWTTKKLFLLNSGRIKIAWNPSTPKTLKLLFSFSWKRKRDQSQKVLRKNIIIISVVAEICVYVRCYNLWLLWSKVDFRVSKAFCSPLNLLFESGLLLIQQSSEIIPAFIWQQSKWHAWQFHKGRWVTVQV